MRRVAIVGVGTTPRNPEYMRLSDTRSWQDYVVEAAYEAIGDVQKGLNPRDLQYAMVNYHGEASVEHGGIGPVVSECLGLLPMGVTPICSNCTGAGVGLHEAYGLVASGRYDRVLVVGFDKWFDLVNPGDERGIGGDVDYDYSVGFDHPTLQAAIQAFAYRKWGMKKVLKALASYRMQSVWWSIRNPKAARWGTKTSVTERELHAMVDSMPDDGPIPPDFWAKLPKNCNLEGAAAVILAPAEDARAYTDHPVYLEAVAYKCNSHLLSKQMYYPAPGLETYDVCDFGATQLAAADAYRMARMSPKELDFAEVYESHITSLAPTIAATGVTDLDHVLDFMIAGETGPGGRLPTGTAGGHGGFGHTSGSDFADHVYEVVHQMRGDAGERQLKKTDAAIIVGMQGEMASSAVALLRNC